MDPAPEPRDEAGLRALGGEWMSPSIRFATSLALASLLLTGCGGKAPRSLHEAAGGFSYDPPAGWTVSEFPGLKYRVATGPVQNGFASNINVVDEAFAGSLADYVEMNVSMIQKVIVSARVVRREEFQTADLAPASRVIVEDEQQGRRLRQSFYFFDGGRRKYVASCSTGVDGADALDASFEASMKTFRTD
jgi:hypothetical protein